MSWLAPGGHLIVSDVINTMAAASPHPAVRALTRAYDQALVTTLDSDLNYARTYPTPHRRRLQRRRHGRRHPLVRADSHTARFWELTFSAMRTEILATGLIGATDFTAAINHLTAPGTHELGYTLVTAWGRSALTAGHSSQAVAPGKSPTSSCSTVLPRASAISTRSAADASAWVGSQSMPFQTAYSTSVIGSSYHCQAG